MRRCASVVIVGLFLLVVWTGSALAAFPGANGLIASSRSTPIPSEVWLVSPATGHADFFGSALASPAWSPDGRRLLVTEGYTGTSAVVLDLQGNSYPYSTCISLGGRTYGNAGGWAPDGRHVVFGCQSSNGAIFVGELGSGHGYAVPLTNDGYSPAWSPDGKTIAFVRDTGIWLMNSDGTGQRRLIDLPGTDEYRPDWSPDGKQLAFSADSEPPPGCCGAGNLDVYVVSADGKGLKRLTYSAGPDTGPAFSPDGRLVVFASRRPGHGELYLMHRDGTEQVRLTHTPPRDGSPPPGEPPRYDEYGDPDWQPIPKIGRPCAEYRGSVRFTNSQCRRTIPRSSGL